MVKKKSFLNSDMIYNNHTNENLNYNRATQDITFVYVNNHEKLHHFSIIIWIDSACVQIDYRVHFSLTVDKKPWRRSSFTRE